MRKVYLSLGSNKDYRELYLQLAVALIHYRAGNVLSISSIVETPAWGFDGAAFYNCCLLLETYLSPQALLNELIAIEECLGRKRSAAKGYQNRSIDLDILFYDDEIITLPQLSIPHPRIEARNFVLVPLYQIAATYTHPVSGQSMQQLLDQSPDPTTVTTVVTSLFLPKRKKFIAIEGNIGAGKTSFSHKLKEAIGGTLLLENFYDNPYLADFYQDPKKYALQVETAFLKDRVKQLSHFFSHKNNEPVIADFSLEKSLLFARQNLEQNDFIAYRETFFNLSKDLPQPNIVLFLDQKISQLQHNIQKRGRSFECNISNDYLKKIEEGYQQWQAESTLNICFMDTKGLNFVEDASAFYRLLLTFCRP